MNVPTNVMEIKVHISTVIGISLASVGKCTLDLIKNILKRMK